MLSEYVMGMALATLAKHHVEDVRTLAQLLVLEQWTNGSCPGQQYGVPIPRTKAAATDVAMRLAAFALSQAEAWQMGIRDESISDTTYQAANRGSTIQAVFQR